MALTPEEQIILDRVRTEGQGTVQEMLQQLGMEPSYTNYQNVSAYLARNGITAPMTIGENQGNLARDAMAAGQTKALTPWQQTAVQSYTARGMNDVQITAEFNDQGHPVQLQDVRDILAAAGLNDFITRPNNSLGEVPTQPATTPKPPEYNGGMPGRQDQGGMYGTAPQDYVPPNVAGEVPRDPALRRVFNQSRRENRQGWAGQTDTILTSAQGVTGQANVLRRQLLGA